VGVFRQIEVLDIRPQNVGFHNIVFIQCDLMDLPSKFVEYCDSLSCLHTLEHFGLGRYGDAIDINGHLKGFESLYKMLQPGGILYLSFPIGKECIEFNSHRIFAIKTVMEWAEERFELACFSYVNDDGHFFENVVLDDQAILDSFGLTHGCGIFEFRKITKTLN
jgi:SAM-dependent methyltransferase